MADGVQIDPPFQLVLRHDEVLQKELASRSVGDAFDQARLGLAAPLEAAEIDSPGLPSSPWSGLTSPPLLLLLRLAEP
jgi:hypothetical protein